MRNVRTLLEHLEADVADSSARAGFGGVPLDVFGWDELVDGRVEVLRGRARCERLASSMRKDGLQGGLAGLRGAARTEGRQS